MATPVDKDSQKLKTDLLHLIKWKDAQGKVQKLKLYSVLSSLWEKVSDLLRLDHNIRKCIADKNNRDPEKCIRDVIEKWMQDEKSLSSNYKRTWNGLCLLLEDLEQSTMASELKAALAADNSSFNNNFDEEASAKAGTGKFYTNSSSRMIKPFLPDGYCKGAPLNTKARKLEFPGIDLEELQEEEKEDLKNTLSEESYSLAEKFMEIQLNFYSYLEENSINCMPTIQIMLNSFLKWPPLYDGERNVRLKRFTSNITIQDISEFLDQYCSFFNYDLLRKIFTRIQYQDGLELLERHDKDLAQYAKKRICHFPSGVGMLTDCVVVAVKLDDMYEGCNILHLLRFHKNLCNILKVTLGQFTLDGLRPGCVCITFHLLKSLLNTVFPLSKEVVDKLKATTCHKANIISLSCETFIYHCEDEEHSDTLLKQHQYQLHEEAPKEKDKEHHRQKKDLLKEKEGVHPKQIKKRKHSKQEMEEEHSQQNKKKKHSRQEMEEEHSRQNKRKKHSGQEMEEEHSWLEKERKYTKKCAHHIQEREEELWWKGERKHLQQASASTLSIQLNWRRGPDMPVAMSEYVQAVKINDTLYFGGGITLKSDDAYRVMKFEMQSSKWHSLPQYSSRWFAMTTFKNHLVLVGGLAKDSSVSPELGEWQPDSNEWACPFPPMLIPRWAPSATSYRHWIVVAGGRCHGDCLYSVEILDVSNMQWSTGPSTPTPWDTMRSITLRDSWYLMGGRWNITDWRLDVFSVSLKALVSQSKSNSAYIWKELPSLDCTQSCPLTIKGSLLAVGGWDQQTVHPVSAIQCYVPETNTWVQAGLLPHAAACNACIATSEELYILGEEGHVYIAKV